MLKKVVGILAVIFVLSISQSHAQLPTTYSSDNYQIIVDPHVESPFSSQTVLDPSTETTGTLETTGYIQTAGWKQLGTGETSVALLADNLLPSNFTTPPVTSSAHLTANFLTNGAIYLAISTPPQDQRGTVLSDTFCGACDPNKKYRWTNADKFGFGINTTNNNRFSPLASYANLQSPTKIAAGKSINQNFWFKINFPSSKREFTFSSKVIYLIIPTI